ncbi:MAG: hypothetical protein ACK48P_04820 [Holosporales bacterium]|jgi:uncharacterized protein YceK
MKRFFLLVIVLLLLSGVGIIVSALNAAPTKKEKIVPIQIYSSRQP